MEKVFVIKFYADNGEMYEDFVSSEGVIAIHKTLDGAIKDISEFVPTGEWMHKNLFSMDMTNHEKEIVEVDICKYAEEADIDVKNSERRWILEEGPHTWYTECLHAWIEEFDLLA